MNLSEFDLNIQRFIEAAIQSSQKVDYSKKAEVRTHNQAVNCYRKIAKSINDKYPSKLSDFSRLLNYESDYVRLCCAVCMIEFMNFSAAQKQNAFNTVQKYIDSIDDSIEKAGLSIWIRNQKKINMSV